MNQSINQLINDEAVCRTAPATPGLSIKQCLVKFSDADFRKTIF